MREQTAKMNASEGDETHALRGPASTVGDGGDLEVRARIVTAQVVKS
jgi:hypothetical protein